MRLISPDFELEVLEEFTFISQSGFIFGFNTEDLILPFTVDIAKQSFFQNELKKKHPKTKYPVRIEDISQTTRFGEFRIQELRGNTMQCTVVVYKYDKSIDLDIPLSDLDLGAYISEDIYVSVEESMQSQGTLDTDVNFPQVYRFLDDSNGMYDNFEYILNEKKTPEGYSFTGSILQPFPYLTAITKRILQASGMEISGSFFEEEIYQSILYAPEEPAHLIIGAQKTHVFTSEDIVVDDYVSDPAFPGMSLRRRTLRTSFFPNYSTHAKLQLFGNSTTVQNPLVSVPMISIKASILGQSIGQYHTPQGSSTGVAIDIDISNHPEYIGLPVDVEVVHVDWNYGWLELYDSQGKVYENLDLICIDENGVEVDTLSVYNPNSFPYSRLVNGEETVREWIEKLEEDYPLSISIKGKKISIDTVSTIEGKKLYAKNMTDYILGEPRYVFPYGKETVYTFGYPSSNTWIVSESYSFGDEILHSTENKEIKRPPLPFYSHYSKNIYTTRYTEPAQEGYLFFDRSIDALNCLSLYSGLTKFFEVFLKKKQEITTQSKQIDAQVEDSIFSPSVDDVVYVDGQYYLVGESEEETSGSTLRQVVTLYSI